MNLLEEIKEVDSNCVVGVRGPGCFSIEMEDGRTLYWDGNHILCYSEDGELLEKQAPENISGNHEVISVDFSYI